MERLEAALEKARKDRETVQAVIAAAEPEESTARHPARTIGWDALKEINISNRVARNQRITSIQQSKDSGPYDLLRTRTLKIMGDNDWTSLAVTSPNKACGKTTVSVNLAFSLARQTDLKILVLDLDLRRPAMHKVLTHRAENSLHEVLMDQHPLESAFVRVGDNLAFGLNNNPANNPSELLQSKLTKVRLAEIRETFQPDLTIFDMPPMLVSDENVGFLPLVDCGLLVGAADSTTIAQLDICEKELSELTNVLGIVLNKCKYTDKDTGYDYEYY